MYHSLQDPLTPNSDIVSKQNGPILGLVADKPEMTDIRLTRKGPLLEIISSLKVANGPLEICSTSG